MKLKSHGVLVAAFGLLLGAIPVLAHHSISAEFDPTKEWTQTGVLSKIDWINPHTATYITVKDASGKMEEYGCEGNPPATYHRAGLNKKDWIVGQTVTMTCAAAKDGTHNWGFLKMLKYQSDGHVLVFRIGGE
jgi:hypothetical protein